ncbi:MAG: glycosyltransferase [Phycisphaeraceae bacterium]
MRILYLAQRYDYGNPSNGLSFEHFNFYESLCAMGHELTYFDYPSLISDLGRTKANRRLEAIVQGKQPDLLFGVVRRDLVSKRTMRRISEQSDTTTINWFCDDHWQFDSHARGWTPCFNHVVTTSQNAYAGYQAHGLTNVIKSQWGDNHTLYKPTDEPFKYDVTFVGQPYGMREQAIQTLQRAGINVRAWGSGWPDGKLSQSEMIRVFSQSRINLNFADASSSSRTKLEAIAASHTVSSLRTKPALWRLWSGAQRLAAWDKQRAATPDIAPPRQIKGRVFEVPACGGFLLTQPAEDLDTYLKPGQDCATFETIDELVDQVRYYLKHEDDRRDIASRGYQRTLGEHTYAARFEAIFEQAGIKSAHTPIRKAA